MQQHPISTAHSFSRRSFLKAATAVASAPIVASLANGNATAAEARLVAYVGTYSAPLKNVAKTQVDLPPGNGRGIHSFTVDRATGVLSPASVFEMGSSPSCLVINAAGTRMYSSNETDHMGTAEPGTVSAFAIDRTTGQLTLLNMVS